MKTFEYLMCSGRTGIVEADGFEFGPDGLVSFHRNGEAVAILAHGCWQSVAECAVLSETETDRPDDGA